MACTFDRDTRDHFEAIPVKRTLLREAMEGCFRDG